MEFFRTAVALSTAALLSTSALAHAEGETDYQPGVCGGAHGSPAPKFNTLIDLPILFANIGTYTLLPEQMYGPQTPWTNWYHETDMKKSLAKLATMRSILEKNNLWDTYRVAEPPRPACPAGHKTSRQIDGTCNHLEKTWMGA